MVQLVEDVIPHPILQDSTPKRKSLVFGLLAPMRLLIANAKVLDSKGKKIVKPSFLYGDVIASNDFIAVAEEHHWLRGLRGVDGHMMFLPSMVRGYSICDFQLESIARVMVRGNFCFPRQSGLRSH